LLTGRYAYRTGVTEVSHGRSLLREDETTLADLFNQAGYQTAIFGKWHLGDNYPMRPSDNGFQECLVHKGGGIGQSGGPPGNRYFDPVLEHNNKSKRYNGYCNDIFFDKAIKYIKKNHNQPFFVYLATNLPHLPLEIGEDYVEPYRQKGMNELNAKTYGMITNIDDNVGRLLSSLDEMDLSENTIVIFLSDNGPRTSRIKNDVYPDRYNYGLRGTKTSVYEGGIRVPFFIRYPRIFRPQKIDTIAAHIDVLPTLVETCGLPESHKTLDGQSLYPLLVGNQNIYPDRSLFFQLNNHNHPLIYAHFSVRSQKYKLVQPDPNPRNRYLDLAEYDQNAFVSGLELYDIENDPGEIDNLAEQYPKIAASMLQQHEMWFNNVTAQRNYFTPQKIYIGTPHENPVILSQFDMRMISGLGQWDIKITETGIYNVTLKYPKTTRAGHAYLRVGSLHREQSIQKATDQCVFNSIKLEKQNTKCFAWIKPDEKPKEVHFVIFERIS
jgi:arylsulfatase/arylsulfatase A